MDRMEIPRPRKLVPLVRQPDLIEDDTEDDEPSQAPLGEASAARSSTEGSTPSRSSRRLDSSEFDTPNDADFLSMKPYNLRLGDRTASTSVRLRRQGFTASRSGADFAVRSIRRGTGDWMSLIKPFVSDLAFRSVISRRYQSEVSFRPYTCHAAVLFVDLSSYSKITAAIAHRGAHALSNIVNAYLGRILRIVQNYGGDVVKFAGDAVLIVWEGTEAQMGMNLLCAASCSLDIQHQAGSHAVDGTSLAFQVHIGLCCGPLESEIFEAPVHNNMQRLYHSVGGESLYEISELVDLARAGQVCISEPALDLLGNKASCCDLDSPSLTDAKLLVELNLEADEWEAMENHIEQSLTDRMLRRNKEVEEDFIHPSVVRLLSHGGVNPTQIAQMRNLCVLFIAMTSYGSSVNWLMEVQAILDRNRCPIVQIIDDDKGVHIVAAINLYETVPETSWRGLQTCHELVEKQVGCAIGVAIGPTFCGVTGWAQIACRWDITGPPAVRAARLMQYALANELHVAVDQTVYDDPVASVRLEVHDCSVELKGTDKPVAVYTLSHATIVSAFRILETEHANVHNDMVKEIQDHISGKPSRSAAVVTGMPLSGKKIVCQRAAGGADLVPFLHICDEHGGLLQLARTIAVWFSYSDVDDASYLADSVMDHINRSHWSRAHDECIRLVNVALEAGLRACFLVDRVQFLDEFSLSLMRECLNGQQGLRRGSRLRHSSSRSEYSYHGGSNRKGYDEDMLPLETGKICFLCVHVPLYNWKTAADVVEDITRSHKTFQVPIFELLEAPKEQLRAMFRDLSDMEVEDRWLDAYTESSGFTAGYFIERAAASRLLSGKLWSQGMKGIAETSDELVLSIPPGLVRSNRLIPVTQVSAEVAMRFHQIYDELPPLFQTFAKVLAIATRKSLYKLPRFIMWEVLNDLISEGVEATVMPIVVDELVEMFLVKVESKDDEDVLSFRTPGLADIAYDVCTPVQIHAIGIALLERLEPLINRNFQVPLLMADLHLELQQKEELTKQYWMISCKLFKEESKDWPKRQVEKWKELIVDEIQAGGYDAADILGDDFFVPCLSRPSVGNTLPLLKMYSAPVALGPMGHTLSVLCRNTFHEWAACRAHKDSIDNLQASTQSAADRYLKEMAVVENFLNRYGIPSSAEDLQDERDMIEFIATPAACGEMVQAKAVKVLDELVPRAVEPRLQRLYTLVRKLRNEEVPDVVQNGPEAIRKAYAHFRTRGCGVWKCRQDAAQNALMTLATMNWKPKPIPEFLPILHHQTVARIRNKTLKRLSDAEAILFRHQQSIDDLEVFLVVTPLLYAAQEQGLC